VPEIATRLRPRTGRREAEYQDIVQAANRAGLEHLQRWAVTRAGNHGNHGARVDGQEPGRYEDAGLVVTSWLQGTSRDGDPQDQSTTRSPG
jgi:hypothetical protein